MHNVGMIGAGPGAWALHIPTIGALGDEFRLVHVADAGGGRAAAIASRAGVRWSPHADGVLEDPDVDVVAICSPPATHAKLICAAVAAGKRTIFCEKPIAVDVDELESVLATCSSAGVILVVGTNHLFDPVWEHVTHRLDAAGARVLSASLTLSLAPNDRYHDLVSAAIAAPSPPARAPIDTADPMIAAAVVRQLLIGLAIHDLPLIRDLLPTFDGCVHARAVAPIGYDVGFRAGGALVRLSAVMNPGGADTAWRLSIVTTHDRIDVEFPPPFVHDGSARASVRDESGRSIRFPPEADDGYQREWRAMAELLRGERAMEYSELEADARFAIALADAAATTIRAGAR